MSKKVVFNLILILVLLLTFPLLWLFNQRINYRKFLTLNTKFSLDANAQNPQELSSISYIYEYLKENGVSIRLHVDVVSRDEFKVLGRKLITAEGNIEIYEYSSKSDALDQLEIVRDTTELVNKVYLYKNLLIYNKNDLKEIADLLEGLGNEKMD